MPSDTDSEAKAPEAPERAAETEAVAVTAATSYPAADDPDYLAFLAWKRAKEAGADPSKLGDDGLVAVTLVKPLELVLDVALRHKHANHGAESDRLKLPPGRYRMPPEIAGHWFVKLHTDDPPPTIRPVGSEIYIAEQRRKQAQQQLLPPESEAKIIAALAEKLKAEGWTPPPAKAD